jgi:hypothetical protein
MKSKLKTKMIHMRLSLSGFLIAICCLFLAGCQSVPTASPEVSAQAKVFTSSQNKTKLYVYRRPGQFGQAGMWQVAINGKIAGATAPGTFGTWELEPGEYTLSSYGYMGMGNLVANLKLNLLQGKTHFVELRFQNELVGGKMYLKEVDETTGQAFVNRCKLIESIY